MCKSKGEIIADKILKTCTEVLNVVENKFSNRPYIKRKLFYEICKKNETKPTIILKIVCPTFVKPKTKKKKDA